MSAVRSSWYGWTFALGAVLAASAGCKPKPEETAAPGTEVVLAVRATKDSNGGRPLHIVVRVVTRETFVEDDYADVAILVVRDDESVVERLIVFPGQSYERKIRLEKPPVALGVYGLFTNAEGESWKYFAEEPATIAVSTGPSSLGNTQVVKAR